VYSMGRGAEISIGEAMRGRVLDAMAMPMDGGGPMLGTEMWPLDGGVTAAMDRVPIREALTTGVKAIDGMLTVA